MMKKTSLFIASLLCAGLMSSCGENTGNKSQSANLAPELTRMKCEFVPDGGTAIIYGKNLTNAELSFPGGKNLNPTIIEQNDTMIICTVPEGSSEGRIKVSSPNGKGISKFFFRDNRNTIINYDRRLATWGGYSPMEEDGTLITGTLEMGDSITPFPNGAKLPEPCSGNYGFLYGKYSNAWAMNQCMYFQYVANPLEGGRGDISVAGKVFDKYDLEELALKFEVYVPKEIPYKDIKTEIFFGNYTSADKHGRTYAPICFWEPYKNTSNGFYTEDGWETVTIPLTEFCHNTETDERVESYVYEPSLLKHSTNFSFLQFGNPSGEPQIFMCVDNFRLVPIEK